MFPRCFSLIQLLTLSNFHLTFRHTVFHRTFWLAFCVISALLPFLPWFDRAFSLQLFQTHHCSASNSSSFLHLSNLWILAIERNFCLCSTWDIPQQLTAKKRRQRANRRHTISTVRSEKTWEETVWWQVSTEGGAKKMKLECNNKILSNKNGVSGVEDRHLDH